jgi:hypothetical protein
VAVAGAWFGVHWAYHSWWGVAALLVAGLLYVILVVAVQAAQQENALKTEGGIGAVSVPEGAPEAVAKVLAACDFYAVLDIAREATPEEVRHAGKLKKLRTHPDKTGGAPGSNEAIQRVRQAEEALLNADSRLRYDRILAAVERGGGEANHAKDEDETDADFGGGGKNGVPVYERGKGQPRHKSNTKHRSKAKPR